MKKKLSYRDKLIELAYIYDVKEIKDYVKSRKNLTSGQLELILKKNKIVIPKDFKSNFLRDNIFKPVGKIVSRGSTPSRVVTLLGASFANSSKINARSSSVTDLPVWLK